MRVKAIATGCMITAVAAGGMPAQAPASDALVGGLIGGVVGGMVSGAIQRDQQRTRTVVRTAPRSSVPSATREANREMQTALNYFSFPAGTPDGIVGRNTRNAVSQYQAYLGYPVTGQITQFERDFLVTSYRRAMAGGPMTAQMVATNPQGVRGLLLQYRDELARGATATAAPMAPGFVVAPAAPAPQAAAAAPAAEEPAAPAPAAAPGLPNFIGDLPVQASLASHCNRVSLVTNSNGGFTTLAAMSDPAFVLEEQFCLARTYAIADGEEMAARVPGSSPAQIAQQCEGLGTAMRPQMAGLTMGTPSEVMREVSGFIATSGMAPVQVAATGRICLSSGYRTDDMEVALGAALLLAAVGERAYGELIGHHLAQGFGTSKRPDLARDWYEIGVAAVAAGAPAPFLPGQPERVELIRAAALGGGAPAQVAPAAMPSFGVAPSKGD